MDVAYAPDVLQADADAVDAEAVPDERERMRQG